MLGLSICQLVPNPAINLGHLLEINQNLTQENSKTVDAWMQFHSLMIILIASYHATEPVRPASLSFMQIAS